MPSISHKVGVLILGFFCLVVSLRTTSTSKFLSMARPAPDIAFSLPPLCVWECVSFKVFCLLDTKEQTKKEKEHIEKKS